MFKRSSTALVFAAAIFLLPPGAHAFKTGASVHPMAAAAPHPIHAPPRVVVPHIHSKPVVGPNGKILHPFHKFAHHHHRHRFLAFGLPSEWNPFYGPYYDPAALPAYDEPDLSDDTPTGSLRQGAFYRTGCRSEDVSVPSSHGPTRVTITRCSVPIVEALPPK